MSGPETGTQPRATMPLTRGFLFADLRGYTDFVQAHGDGAARDLLQAYRSIVRGIIGRFDGAEIRTEGDSFYVVFPSATGAVRCALEIQAEMSREPDRPIRVGIGIHAGESAEDAEGYVGLAVNIAARVCSLARPGEVLVSETVRSLTRSSGALTFTSMGRRHLKGVAESVAIYSVSDGAGPISGRTSMGRSATPRVRTLATIAILVLLVAGTVGAFALGPFRPASGSSPFPSLAVLPSPGSTGPSAPTGAQTAGSAAAVIPSALPMSDGLAPHVTTVPGHYATTTFKPRMVFELSTGWEAVADDPDSVALIRQTSKRGPSDGALSFSRVHVAFTGPCAASKTHLVGEGTDAVITWLEGLDYLTISAPSSVYVGGASGVQLKTKVAAKGPGCPNLPTSDPDWYALFPDGRGVFYLQPGSTVGFTVMDIAGQTVLMITEQPPDRVTDFAHEVEAFLLTVEFQ